MNSSAAAAIVSSNTGVNAEHIEIIDVQTWTESDGDVLVHWTRITYRITRKGAEGAQAILDRRLSSQWEVSAAQMEAFRMAFSAATNYEYVLRAMTQGPLYRRFGAMHAARVALELGAFEVDGFEVSHIPTSGVRQSIDIVTRSSIAVEAKAKASLRPATLVDIKRACEQAERRLRATPRGEDYNAVIIVYPDGLLSGLPDSRVLDTLRSNRQIRVCEVKDLNRTMDQLSPERHALWNDSLWNRLSQKFTRRGTRR